MLGIYTRIITEAVMYTIVDFPGGRRRVCQPHQHRGLAGFAQGRWTACAGEPRRRTRAAAVHECSRHAALHGQSPLARSIGRAWPLTESVRLVWRHRGGLGQALAAAAGHSVPR